MSTVLGPERWLGAAVGERERLLRDYVGAEQERIARACHAIARSFSRGGMLVPFGVGPAASDAAHAAVEFMHPIIVGKRALPARLPPVPDPHDALAAAGPDDIALGLAHSTADREPWLEFLQGARRRGMLTIAFGPRELGADPGGFDYAFAIPSDDPIAVQEVQETIYHVFWELVHTFFEHPGLLEDSCITCGDVAIEAEVVEFDADAANAVVELGGARERVATELVGDVALGDRLLCHAGVAIERIEGERGSAAEAADDAGSTATADDPSGFLYPFLEAEESDLDSVLADVRDSTVRKAEDVIALRAAIDVGRIARLGRRVRERLASGGRAFSFGNGGSATDAQDLAIDLRARNWPAMCLTDDVATLSAIGNDVGFDKVFARQLIPLGRAPDVAIAITTSGNSANVLAGLEEAHRRGMLCCAIAGYNGGRLAELDWLAELFVIESDYVPRIQEAQATVYHLLVEAIGANG